MFKKVLLLDPHPVVRAGIKSYMERAEPRRFDVVGEASYPDELHTALETFRPDVLLTEADVPFKSGLSVSHDVFRTLGHVVKLEQTSIVFYARDPSDIHVARAHTLGAIAFLSKADPWTTAYDELVGAVQLGKPLEHSRLAAGTKKRMSAEHDTDMPLTNREVQVLRHVATGLSNGEIGKALGISIETVKEHVQNMLRKLGCNDRTQAAVWAVKKGLV
jgi:DNA-binding NarL/FixJ family response regulator